MNSPETIATLAEQVERAFANLATLTGLNNLPAPMTAALTTAPDVKVTVFLDSLAKLNGWADAANLAVGYERHHIYTAHGIYGGTRVEFRCYDETGPR